MSVKYETKELIIEAKSVEDAVAMGKEKLGEDAEFEIVAMPEKKFFGFKQTMAKVRVFINIPVEEKPVKKVNNFEKPIKQEKNEKQEEITEEIKKEIVITNEKDYNNYVSKALSILKEIIKNMGIEKVSYKVSQEETEAMIIIEGEEASFLIGHHGETMSALQYLLSLSVNRKKDDYFRIILNIENYREKREKTLEAFAIKSAKNVVKTGRSQLLEPMNPYERRIIHAAVQKVDGAISSSIGEEPNRKVVIKSKNPRKPYNKRNNYDNKKPYDNKRPYDQNRNYKPYNTNNKPQEQTKSTTSNEVKEKKSDVNFGSLYGKIDLD